MSARHWVVGGLLSSSVFAGLAQGCGASVSNTGDSGPDTAVDMTSPPVDTGHDAFAPTPEAGRDVAIDSIADSPSEACEVDADLETIMIPDAAIGSSTIGLCLACAKASCSSEIAACDADCACKEALVTVLACVAGGTSFLTCAASAASEMNAEELGLCIYSACPVSCGIKTATPEGGMDAPFEAAHGG
jgi:hypothetical protein